MSAKIAAASRVAHCCKSRQEGRNFKDEICRQGVVQAMVHAVAVLEDQRGQLELRLSLLRALAECVYDHRGNAALAARGGVLKVNAMALRRANGDESLVEHQLCVANNVIGMSDVPLPLLQEAEIIPVLVELASSTAERTRCGQQIATAALANLTNNAQLREHLIQAGAVQSLSFALLQYQPEEEEAVEVPSISYMQSLSAVVKVVGSGCLMGNGSHARQCDLSLDSEEDRLVFRVQGSRSSRNCDLAVAEALVVDRRSARWMLQYLEAAVEGCPYPPESNVYGTTWKVALSIACMAHGCSANRKLLAEVGVWPVLFRALRKEGKDREDRELTEANVVMAMRSMLRGPEEVAMCQWNTSQVDGQVVLNSLRTISEGCGTTTKMPVRETAAELLLIWNQGWEVERLLWLAVCKGEATQLHKVAKVMGSDAAAASSDVSCYRQQQRQCHMNMLQPSMIRRIMKHFVLLGGLQHGCTCE